MSGRKHGSTLLHQCNLLPHQTKKLPARSDNHANAYVRLHPEDVKMLTGRKPHALQPLVALFCTKNTSEPVVLRNDEVIRVSIHGKTSADAPSVSLRVVAHHAYVSGMRVSGTIHRPIVRLVSN
jgi:hypothetical protein